MLWEGKFLAQDNSKKLLADSRFETFTEYCLFLSLKIFNNSVHS